MIKAFLPTGFHSVDATAADAALLLQQALWIDLLEPAAEEIGAVEAILGLELPTRKEAQEIEVSSRLYVEGGVVFMTLTVLLHADTTSPETTPITFAYGRERLVTLRFAEPAPLRTFPAKLQRTPQSFSTAQRVFLGLIDEIVDRAADILELVAADVNAISRVVFGGSPARGAASGVDYNEILTRIGHDGERAAGARESMVSAGRLLSFFEANRVESEPLDQHWATVAKDVTALTEHATFLSGKVNFALDATLGRINSEQNTIIKLFSVLAVVFLPPTLIASIYGMNFDVFPELHWRLGYPLSLGLMLAAAILPYVFFKRKGWL